MIIKNLDNEYEVMRMREKVSFHSHNPVYLCRYQFGSDKSIALHGKGAGEHLGEVLQGNVCEVICLADMSENKEVLHFFNSVLQKKLWQDLRECFVKKGSIFVVVNHYPYHNLAELLKEQEFSLSEKVKIFENLCEGIVLQNMPYYLLHDALKKEHVVMDRYMGIHMRYGLDDIRNYQEYTMNDVCHSVLFWFKMIFEKECLYQSSDRLTQFMKWLKLGKNDSAQEINGYMELYKKYMEVSRELLKLHEEGELYVYQTLPYIIWKKVIECVSRIKYMLLALILLITIAVSLLYYKSYSERANSHVFLLDRIGTVEIEGNLGKNHSMSRSTPWKKALHE